MKEEKYKCPLCQISHNFSNDNINKIHSNDEKLLCSSCINQLLSKENNLVFPHDFIDYKSINTTNDIKNDNNRNDEIKHQTINESIIEEIKQQSMNKILIEEIKQQVYNKTIINSNKPAPNASNININNNSKNISKSDKYYVKKSVKVNKLPEFKNKDLYDTPKCNIHSLPLNIICIDEKIKICSQCALTKNHLNHKIIIEKDFIQYIEELSKIYTNIEINQNKYINIDNNNFSVIEEINNIFLETEKNLTELKNKIINNINNQFNMILNFMNLRRKEITDKYQYSNYDINNLIETSKNWAKLVSEKLNESNIKNNNYKNINILQLLDKDENKNIFNLINSGKQLNERYNFMKEINQIMDKLEYYKEQGITIKQNEEIINSIINKNKIIFIEENQELIKSLSLTPYDDLIKEFKSLNNKPKNNIDININNDTCDNDNDEIIYEDNNNKPAKNIQNNKSNIKNKCLIFDGNQNKKHKVYFRKVPAEMESANFTETDCYKEKTNKKINNNQNNLNDNNNNNTCQKISNTNSKRKVLSTKKIKYDINNTESNESTFPLNNMNKTDKKMTKLLRNKTTGNMNPKIIKKQNKNESIELSNYNDNKININFNGHIFNYNSDSNFSINIPEINKKSKNDENNTSKITDIFELLTPKKNEIKIKKVKNSGKQKLMRCFSFNEETNKNKNKNKINMKKNLSNSIVNKITQSVNNTNINILNTGNNIKKTDEPSFRNFDFFKKTENSNKNLKINKIKYKTLNTKELEKYVNYQLKKLKPNFNRINLRDTGIKIISAFFKKNKNKKYKEIKLQGCNINDLDFDIFTKSLIENNISIPIINLSENKLSDDCTYFILDFINEYNDIQNIFLTNNLFSKGIKEKIKEILKIRKNQENDIIINL